jgi:hypothetical protein
MKTALARLLGLAALGLALHQTHAGNVSFSFSFGLPVVAPVAVCPPAPCAPPPPRICATPAVPVFAPPRAIVPVWVPPACGPVVVYGHPRVRVATPAYVAYPVPGHPHGQGHPGRGHRR